MIDNNINGPRKLEDIVVNLFLYKSHKFIVCPIFLLGMTPRVDDSIVLSKEAALEH